MLPKTILVPTDFSPNADQALDYACELAGKLGATVHLVHAVTAPPSALQVALTEQMIENLLSEDRAVLDKIVRGRSNVASFGASTVDIGDPRELIINTAKTLGAGMIIMGTHGRRGLSRMVMGSVAESVVRHAPCPVLVIREKRDDE